MDLGVALAAVLVSLACTPALNAAYRRLTGFAAVLVLASFQFSAEGLVPLVLMGLRREKFSDYGLRWRNLGKSLALAACLAIAYDVALSVHAAAWIWIPLRRHNAVRHSLAAGFPFNVIGLVLVVVTWGFLEAFFGVFFAKKFNQLLGHGGKGWLAPGAWAFALFNGLLHAAIGQGLGGFASSFASGYAIAVIPAATGNAWGSGLFQTATNAIGRL